MNRDGRILLAAVLASLIATYLGWVYLALIPLFIIALRSLLKKSPSQFTADQSAKNQFLTEVAGLIQECENNLIHISVTQKEAISVLNNACKKLSLLQSVIVKDISSQDNQADKNTQIVTITTDIIQGLQFDDINQQNLTFTCATLNFLRGLISELAVQTNDGFEQQIMEQLSLIHKRQRHKINPVASTNLKAGDVELF